jgi:hypothetical protein
VTTLSKSVEKWMKERREKGKLEKEQKETNLLYL